MITINEYKKIFDLTYRLMDTIDTYHLSMSNNHKYCLNIKSHPLIQKLKYETEKIMEKEIEDNIIESCPKCNISLDSTMYVYCPYCKEYIR